MIALGLLIALLVYIYLAKLAVSGVAKLYPGKTAKYLTIAVFVLIPTWDIIPGHLYFRYLCEKEAGVKVFKTARVDKEYFLPDGQPNEKTLSAHYASSFTVNRKYTPLFYITKLQSMIKDKRTGEIFGTATDFGYYGGWLVAYLAPQGPPDTCSAYLSHSVHATVWRQVFQPEPSSSQGGN